MTGCPFRCTLAKPDASKENRDRLRRFDSRELQYNGCPNNIPVDKLFSNQPRKPEFLIRNIILEGGIIDLNTAHWADSFGTVADPN